MSKISIFWFRRDLRLQDNVGLSKALSGDYPVLPVFIFDKNILDILPADDRRVEFIYQTLRKLKQELQAKSSDLLVEYGKPLEVWKKILSEYDVAEVYLNRDYEPYARQRDESVKNILEKNEISFFSFKDQCLFDQTEVLTSQGKPYTVYTPYKNKVLSMLSPGSLASSKSEERLDKLWSISRLKFPSMKDLGFVSGGTVFSGADVSPDRLKNYEKRRDYVEDEEGTSHLGIHLRFGTVSVRKLAQKAQKYSPKWLEELIWRDFFMQILWNFPFVVERSFREDFEKVKWRNSKADFQKWCEGKTGYPLVDAGMRQLNQTGYMHNRARMVTASFLTKNLLIHWREGERYFARHLLDFDLAANNGNWQWAAGTGCDAAPYFRIFNPITQQEKFDPDFEYIKRWVPEWGTSKYPEPMIEASLARGRALAAFAKALSK